MAQQAFIQLTQEQINPQNPETQILFVHTVQLNFEYERKKMSQLFNIQNWYMNLLVDIRGKLNYFMRDHIRTVLWSRHSVLPGEGHRPLLFVIEIQDTSGGGGSIKLYVRAGNLYLVAIQNQYGIFQFTDSQIQIQGAQKIDLQESYLSILGSVVDINTFGAQGYISIETLMDGLIAISHAKHKHKFTNKIIFLIILFFCEAFRFYYVANKNIQCLMNDAPRLNSDPLGLRSRVNSFLYPIFLVDVLHNWENFSATFLRFAGPNEPYPNANTSMLLQNLHVHTSNDMAGILTFLKSG